MVKMVTLSTGERISWAEWECRVGWQNAETAHYWATHPEEHATAQRRYVEAMQRDPHKD